MIPALLVVGAVLCAERSVAEMLANDSGGFDSVQQAQELVREEVNNRRPSFTGAEFIGGMHTSNSTCAFIDGSKRFLHIARNECPISYEAVEVDGLLYDPMGLIRYRCHNYRPAEFIENKVYTLSSNQLLKVLNNPPKDPYRTNWCMLAFFYGPKCVFSQELAPAINAIPYNFPRVVAVAVDATHFSRINTRYGIAGTPTLILWVNGIAIARMDDRPLNNTGVMAFLEEWTDVESHRVTNAEDYPIIINYEPVRSAWETPLAIITVLITAIYYWRSWFLRQTAVSGMLNRLGTNPDAVCAYFNAM